MRTPRTDGGNCNFTSNNTGLDPDFITSDTEDGKPLKKHASEYSLASCSSFSLQECINEFKARKAQRTSTESKNQVDEEDNVVATSEDQDIISQNRSNKKNEKLYKPCENGFCYCFTSDSDEFRRSHNVDAPMQARQNRRSRKSESSQISHYHHHQPTNIFKQKETVPANAKFHKKSNLEKPSAVLATCDDHHNRRLTAISKLKEVTCDNNNPDEAAPFIQIIQELHHNYVLSEVRVNKNKINTQFNCNSNCNSPKKKAHNRNSSNVKLQTSPKRKPEKIVLDKINEIDSLAEEFMSTSLNTSSKSSSSGKRSSQGGRLLKKRLSQSQKQLKPRNFSLPPPKPPRHIPDEKSVSSLASTSPSIREAEQVLNDFLRRKGFHVPGADDSEVIRRDVDKIKRKSFPMEKAFIHEVNEKTIHQKRNFNDYPIPSCPSLSDFDQRKEVKAKTNDVDDNIKHHTIGWNEPKISEMLNFDAKSFKNKDFQSNYPAVGPQTAGWTVPPKQDIDTVDGDYHNLAANMETKSTPIKAEIFERKGGCKKTSEPCQKFVFKEQLRNLMSNSPWSSVKKKNIKSKPKSNLKSSSSFLNNSKKKIIQFVSNTKESNIPLPRDSRSIGIQTFARDLDLNTDPQSPPGSYFSVMSTTTMTTPSKSQGSQTQFDFTRTINSPPKKDKTIYRKLQFPGCYEQKAPATAYVPLTKTYQSYHSDLDKDVSLSKMGYILANIRAKLEASDEHALRTFREIEHRENRTDAVDCVDGRISNALRIYAQADVHQNNSAPRNADPIYSEIEEDSFVVSGSPLFENTTCVEHFQAENDPLAIYAKVNKTSKKNSSTTSSSTQQLFNNIRMMEHQSPPKRRYSSKSDLSQNQSDCFLENLGETEEQSSNQSIIRLEKVPNATNELESYISFNDGMGSNIEPIAISDIADDTVSYEMPNDAVGDVFTLPLSDNQSTPKKKPGPIHLTQLLLDGEQCVPNVNNGVGGGTLSGISNSCPSTPHRPPPIITETQYCEESQSLNDDMSRTKALPNAMSTSTMLRYRHIKDKIRKSFRKSKNYIKAEGKRLSTSLNMQGGHNTNERQWDHSSLGLDNIFALDDDAPVEDQLAQAVTLCRKMPDLEISPEMVEAERLLLFSSLKRVDKTRNKKPQDKMEMSTNRLGVDALRIPIKSDTNQDLFFNYYYFGVFSCGYQVKSTQSVECRNHEAIFRDCDILFADLTETETRCDLFMLRLRKVSTAKVSNVCASNLSNPAAASSSSSGDEIVSRFRLHGSFVIRPIDFAPFECCDSEQSSSNSNYIRLHASNQCTLPVTSVTRGTNLPSQVHLSGKAAVQFPKFRHSGFLNVQDPKQKHSWNRRWCVLNGLMLCVRQDDSSLREEDLISACDLTRCTESVPIECAPRDLCARPRSFRLTHSTNEYFFSAENQYDLCAWLQALNQVLNFIHKWMK